MKSTNDALIREAHANWEDGPLLARIGAELQSRVRFEDACVVLERAVALDPQNADAWAQWSYAHFRSLQADEGRRVLRRGIEASGSDWLKTVLANFAADPEEAKRLWDEVADSTEPDATAARLSHRLWQSEDKAAPFAELRALHAAHPDDRRVEENLLWTLLSLASSKAIEGLDVHAIALPLVKARIAREPTGASGWWFLAMLHQVAKDWQGLADATERALAHVPGEETLMQLRGRALRELGDEERAAIWFQRAIGAKPSFAGVRVDLGRLYEGQGKLELAEETFREIPVANPDYPVGPISVAVFLARQDRMEEAAALFASAWPALPDMMKAGLGRDPEVAGLLERVGDGTPAG